MKEKGRVSNIGPQILYGGPGSVIYSMFLSIINTTLSTGPQGFLEETKVLTTISVLSSLYSIIASDADFKSCLQW